MCSLILDTGYKKPPSAFALDDREEIVSLLKTFHCLKAEIDQFTEGLTLIGRLSRIRDIIYFTRGRMSRIRDKIFIEALRS